MPIVTSSIPTATPVLNANDKVDVKSTAYLRMEKKWPLLHDLLGGTETMRAAKETWLPKEPNEEPKDYQLRLDRSVLFNGLKIALSRMVSKPFSRPVTADAEKLPATMQSMVENVDKCGNDLTMFAKELFEKGLQYGLMHVLVDFPKGTQSASLKDEIEQDIRPVFVAISPPQLLGWKYERTQNGSIRITQIRFSETKVEPSGVFGDVEVKYIRVYTAPTETIAEDGTVTTQLGTWELWRWDDTAQAYVQTENGTHTYPGVPLVTFYVNRTGVLEGLPPFEDLMWLNVRHWQLSSDIARHLRMVLSAVFYAVGFDEEKLKEVTFSPNAFLKSANEEAKVGFAEHSGEGVGAGNDERRSIEEQMEALGLQPFMERTAQSTATGKVLDSDKAVSDIQAWIRSLETMLLECFNVAAVWISEELSDEFTINIFNEFGLALRSAQDLDLIMKARTAIPPLLSHETTITEFKRRGVLSDAVVPSEEIERINDELILPPTGTGDELEDETTTVTE